MATDYRASALLRGHACVRCRHRKMKCSGTRPVCSQCEHANAGDECEYLGKNGRSQISILQEDIDRLQSRLFQLEHPNEPEASSSITLHRPYREKTPPPDHCRLDEVQQDSVSMHLLIDTFLTYASELGFFLHPARFRTAALLPYTSGHHARPTAALMNVVYLWGAHLSQDPVLKLQKEGFLADALQQTACALAGSHPNKIMHTVQAEFLLSRYFFSLGKLLEGKYHITCGLSIGLVGGLNKIRSNQPPPPIRAGIGMLPPAVDAVEEGERIMCCWTGFSTDKCWAAALETSSDMICPADVRGAQTDTPWPQELEVYEQGGNFAPEGYSFTSVNFLNSTPTSDRGDSSLAMFAKASYCWERACDLAKDDPWNLEDYAQFLDVYKERRRWISSFLASMTTPEEMTDSMPEKLLRLLEAHSIAHAANIRVLGILPTYSDSHDSVARARSILLSAQTILDFLESPLLKNRRHVNSVMGSVWKLAYQMLIEELKSMRADTGGGPMYAKLAKRLKNGIATISVFAETCLFMKYQLDQIRQACASVDICESSSSGH